MSEVYFTTCDTCGCYGEDEAMTGRCQHREFLEGRSWIRSWTTCWVPLGALWVYDEVGE